MCLAHPACTTGIFRKYFVNRVLILGNIDDFKIKRHSQSKARAVYRLLSRTNGNLPSKEPLSCVSNTHNQNHVARDNHYRLLQAECTSITWINVPQKLVSTQKRKLASADVLQGVKNAPHRSYYKAMGLSDLDLTKPLVGVANTWNEATPCNVHLNLLANKASEGIVASGGTPGSL